jgi:hypothetical protein
MASHATLSLDRGVLKGKRPGFISVAGETNRVFRGGGTQLAPHKAAMLVVAIRAVDKPFIHAMVERLGKIRLDFKMAAVAQGGLRSF